MSRRKKRGTPTTSHKTQPFQAEASQQELTPEEIGLLVLSMAEGTCQALLDHPLLEEQDDILDNLASASSQETDGRRKATWLVGWIGGYKGVLESAQTDPIGTANQASIAKSKTREANLLFYQQLVALNLARSS